jgi:hypothetical protein
MATPGQQAVYRLASSRYMQAVVTKIVSGSTVELVVLGDGVAWGDGDPASLGAKVYTSIPQGSDVGEWLPGTIVDDTVTAAVAGLASGTYVDAEVAGACAVPGAGAPISLALSTPRQPSATRPTQLTVYGTMELASTVLTPQSATVELQSSASSTPTAVVGGPLTASLSGVLATQMSPWTVTYIVPPAHYYQVVKTAGAGTVSITHINEQVM